jgi:hypothetical protein
MGIAAEVHSSGGAVYWTILTMGTLVLYIACGVYSFVKWQRSLNRPDPRMVVRKYEWATLRQIEAEFQSAKRIIRAMGERNG